MTEAQSFSRYSSLDSLVCKEDVSMTLASARSARASAAMARSSHVAANSDFRRNVLTSAASFVAMRSSSCKTLLVARNSSISGVVCVGDIDVAASSSLRISIIEASATATSPSHERTASSLCSTRSVASSRSASVRCRLVFRLMFSRLRFEISSRCSATAYSNSAVFSDKSNISAASSAESFARSRSMLASNLTRSSFT